MSSNRRRQSRYCSCPGPFVPQSHRIDADPRRLTSLSKLDTGLRMTLPSSLTSRLTSSLASSLPSSVRLEPGSGGLPRLAIATRHGTAEIYLQGAHVAAWHPAGTPSPVLWISRESQFTAGRPIRGGVPICFPWFGAHRTEPTAPSHGFARSTDWTLIEAREDADGIVTITLELASAGASQDGREADHQDERQDARHDGRLAEGPDARQDDRRSPWPHAFRARQRVEVGPSLTMALEVHNRDAAPFTFEEALHTYFAVQDIRQVSVTGLEDTEYLDKVAGSSRFRQGVEPIRFTGETDRVYLDTRAACVIHDPALRRRITVRKTASDATVVWNPWIDKARAMPDFGDAEWTGMLCIETANVGAHACTLGPGETYTMTATIDVTGA